MSKPISREEVITAINVVAADVDLAEQPRSYSGRGMYGRNCLGITTNNPTKCGIQLTLKVVSYLADFFEDTDIMEIIDIVEDTLTSRVCTDSMGMSSILYFPEIDYIQQ
jgi:hypothetical protein